MLGEDVLVTGAGPIGCMAVAVVRHAGARHVVVTDLNPYRLELARRMGATLAVDPRERDLADVQRELGMTEGFDVGLEMSGNADALRTMIANMAHGGRIAVLGIPTAEIALDLNPIIFNMLTIKGIYGREMYDTWYQMTVMLAVRARHQAGDHAPLLAPRLRRGVRGRALGSVRQGHPRLDGHLGGAVYGTLRDELTGRLAEVREAGLYKTELVMTTPQGAHVDVEGRELLNLCANNYLGLANHPAMIEAAHEALDRWGYGMASVRFICGTQALHRELEERLSAFLGTEDTILFAPASTRTAASSRRCSTTRTPSSPTSSTTRRSSTASGSARRSGCATRTATWTSSRRGS